MSTKVVTGKVRLSYVNLFEPFSFKEGDPAKYSVMVLVPKKDKATLKKLKAAEELALKDGMATQWEGKKPRDFSPSIFKDGDDYAEDYPEREGCIFFTVRSNTRPGVVDSDVNPIFDPEEVYSGCYGRVSVNAFHYSTGKNSGGVSFGLNNVQKLAEGEPLGGKTRAEDDFSAADDDDDDDDDDIF